MAFAFFAIFDVSVRGLLGLWHR